MNYRMMLAPGAVVFLLTGMCLLAEVTEHSPMSIDLLWKNASSTEIDGARRTWTKRLADVDKETQRATALVGKKLEEVSEEREKSIADAETKLLKSLRSQLDAVLEKRDLQTANAIDALIKRIEADSAQRQAKRSGNVWKLLDANRKRPPRKAVRFRGHSYLWFDEKVTWHVAKRRCEELGGHLLRIDSHAEHAFIEQRLEWEQTKLTWVDGNDEAKEGHFVDYRGEPLKFARWHEGDPNNWSGYQHCLAIGAGAGANLRDETGAHRLRFICEWDYE